MTTLTIRQYAAAHKLDDALMTTIATSGEVDVDDELPADRIQDLHQVAVDTALDDLIEARDDLAHAREQVRLAEEALRKEIRQALEEGVPATLIGKTLGLSRARVYQLRDGKR